MKIQVEYLFILRERDRKGLLTFTLHSRRSDGSDGICGSGDIFLVMTGRLTLLNFAASDFGGCGLPAIIDVASSPPAWAPSIERQRSAIPHHH